MLLRYIQSQFNNVTLYPCSVQLFRDIIKTNLEAVA